jgi:hypothetical protein
MLCDASEELLAFTSFPVSHWKKLWSTNPLERLNKEIKRRTERMSRPPWNFGGGPVGDQAAASSLLGVTVAVVASSAARSAGRCR